MNIDNALQILGLNDHSISEISQTELKQHYRMYALMYHPDKNASNDASIRFLEIKEAYDVLNHELEQLKIEDLDDSINETNYHKILMKYLGIQVMDDKINDILDNILFVCEKQALIILEKTEGKKFEIMYSILKKYKTIFFLSDEFYQQLEQINKIKNPEQEIIELYPSLDDLLQNMIYKLHKDNEMYLVPLWFHELIYEDKKTGKEFVVRCIPNLHIDNEHEHEHEHEHEQEQKQKQEQESKYINTDELPHSIIETHTRWDKLNERDDVYCKVNIQNGVKKEYWIDELNNLHCKIEYYISYIFDKSIKEEKIKVEFGKYKYLYFDPCELKIIKNQTIRWKKEGITIAASELNDISKKADILLHILLL
jgi:hypothetical protein